MGGELTPENAAEAAKHVRGATIAWGGGKYYDFDEPNPEIITLEDAAYALAYTVRWRGQTRNYLGVRCFYGVAEHCIRMAIQLLVDGHGPKNALAGLWHEPDEIPLPDMPGPVKPAIPGWREFAKKQGDAVIARFGIDMPDPALIKRYDIRMLITEKRDLLSRGFDGHHWHNVGGGDETADGFEPFDEVIMPYAHPDMAALGFLKIHDRLIGEIENA